MVDVPFPQLGSDAPPQVDVLIEPSRKGLVLGIASDGDHVVVVGGQGRDLFFHSDDGGQTFRDKASPGRGLRSAFVRGDEIWTCGEWGYAAYSPDRGETWEEIETGADACLFGVGVDEQNHLWLAGDSGFLVHVNAGNTTSVRLTDAGFSRFSPHPEGFLLPSDDPGHLFVVSQGSQRRLGVEAGTNLMKARVLPSGTIVVVGGGGSMFRSTDSGESFLPVESDAHGLLCGVEAFADGRVIVVGQSGGVYFSKDDGATFEVIEQSHSSDYLWCCERLGDGLVVGAHNGTVLKIH